MENCVFCDIINKKIPSYIISENELVTTLLDINPAANGHILVIPNKHIEKLNNIESNDIAYALMTSLIDTADSLIKSGFCEDYMIVQSNGQYAEQSISHLHFHIIPRHKDDDIKLKLDTIEIASLQENLLATREKLLRNDNNFIDVNEG